MNVYELETTIKYYMQYIKPQLRLDTPEIPDYSEYCAWIREHNGCQRLTEYGYRVLVNNGDVVLDK